MSSFNTKFYQAFCMTRTALKYQIDNELEKSLKENIQRNNLDSGKLNLEPIGETNLNESSISEAN